ncbi:ferredoxin-2, mitochondrial [Nephila pilipes]|uniref:Ferredoxin-2, mitochondrial n=1 Tax=Nephila pilipes TaxID=299642 RepID=A0A8X6TYT4_NEPPI|nr:ferredoxin-2, mitochondrial [Nephila pilipes]
MRFIARCFCLELFIWNDSVTTLLKMSFSRVLYSVCSSSQNMWLIQNPSVKLQSINLYVSKTFARNKERWFCSAINSETEEEVDKVKFSFVLPKTGEKVDVEGIVGQNVLTVALENNIGMDGACEGNLSCTTCHVYADKKSREILPAPVEKEEDLLDTAPFLKENSRLSCQCVLNKDLEELRYSEIVEPVLIGI